MQEYLFLGDEALPIMLKISGKFILGELIVCALAVTATVLLMYAHRQVIKRRCNPPFKSSALKLLMKCHSNPIELEERFILATTKKRSIKLDAALVRCFIAKLQKLMIFHKLLFGCPCFDQFPLIRNCKNQLIYGIYHICSRTVD